MAEIVAVADFAPAVREPEDIAASPRRKAHPGPVARDKWVSASVTENIEDMIAAAYDEADRRGGDASVRRSDPRGPEVPVGGRASRIKGPLPAGPRTPLTRRLSTPVSRVRCDVVTVPHCHEVTSWRCRSDTPRRCGCVALKLRHAVAEWRCHVETSCQCGSATVWRLDAVTRSGTRRAR